MTRVVADDLAYSSRTLAPVDSALPVQEDLGAGLALLQNASFVECGAEGFAGGVLDTKAALASRLAARDDLRHTTLHWC